MNQWINKDTEIYCSFAKEAGNTGCQIMNTAFYYYGLNKIYKSFSVSNIQEAVNSVLTLGIKGFAITMPYKIEVLDYVGVYDTGVEEIGAANTVINDNGVLKAYNTDYFAAKTYLNKFDNRKDLYIIGDGGYSKAVRWASVDWKAPIRGINTTIIKRENWDEIENIRESVIYNCTPVDVTSKIHPSNDFINCLVTTKTGRELARLQASKQFELYTGLEFPL